MAPRPGANSSSTRASTRQPAGCTPRAASMSSTNSSKPISAQGRPPVLQIWRRVRAPHAISSATLAYRAPDGSLKTRTFPLYRTHHGPIVREEGGKWVAFAMMHKPVEALQQSYLRTKARDYASFIKVAELKANSSNNTIFADAKGNIAYLHPQFIPVRDDRFDYRKPVDGSDPATDWHGLHAFAERPNLLNPADRLDPEHQQLAVVRRRPEQPKAAAFPRYMDSFGENPRGLHAVALLGPNKDFSLQRPASGRLRYPPARLCPADPRPRRAHGTRQPPPTRSNRSSKPRSRRCATGTRAGAKLRSPTASPIFWGEEMWKAMKPLEWDKGLWIYDQIDRAPPTQNSRRSTPRSSRLTADFGSWQIAVGRDQPLPAPHRRYRPSRSTTARPSRPVGFSSARWGSLASFGAAPRGEFETLVRHQRQQLRRGGRIRPPRKRPRRHRRRRKRPPRLAPLQRPGRPLRHRQPPRRPLPPR